MPDIDRSGWIVSGETCLTWKGPEWQTLSDADKEWAVQEFHKHGTLGNLLHIVIKGGFTPGGLVFGASVARDSAMIRPIAF